MVGDLGTHYQKDEESSKRPNIRIVIPEPLKLQLVDDWEAVTRKNQVRKLFHPLFSINPLAQPSLQNDLFPHRW